MIINCKNILALPYANQMKMAAGERGKWNRISNVHVVEEMTLLDFVDEGELIVSMGCKLSAKVEEWEDFIDNCYRRKAAGFVLCLGYCLKTTPPELIQYCNELEFPLFELRSELRISNVIYSIYQAMFQEAEFQEERNRFFEELIQNRDKITSRKMQRACRYGYDPSVSYNISVVDILQYHTDKLDVKKEIMTVCEYDYLQQTETEINVFFGGKGGHVIVFRKSPYIVSLVPIQEGIDNHEMIKDLCGHLQAEEIQVRIGVSGSLEELGQIPDCYEQSLYVLSLLGSEKEELWAGKTAAFFSDMKIQTLLFELKDTGMLEHIQDTILGKLFVYEKEQGVSLYHVLELYFQHECNISSTAKELYIHGNTLRYRLERIEQVLGCSLKDVDTIFDLKLAIYIHNFLQLEQREHLL